MLAERGSEGRGGAAGEGLNLEVHIPETSLLQMSCVVALVAVMGKLHGEEGHTQLESGKSLGSGWVGGGKWGEVGQSGGEGRHQTRAQEKWERAGDEEAEPTGQEVI